MWKCPICSNNEKNEYVCQICGYDIRKDFVRNRTIQPVPSQDVKTFAKRISDYDEAQRKKAEEAARALLEVIKREQEKKAEAERKAREAEAEVARKEEAARVLLEAIKREQEKKAEAERKAREAEAEAARKAEAERKAREAEAERLARETAEREAKKMYTDLLLNAGIDETTLTDYEKIHLMECCRNGRTMAEGFVSHIKLGRIKASKEDRQVRETPTKKSSKVLKAAAIFILLGIGGAVASSMTGGSQQSEINYGAYEGEGYTDTESAYQSVEEAWNQVRLASKESLNDSSIYYETDSLESIAEYWESLGYTVTLSPMSYDEEHNETTQSVNGYNNSEYLDCYDWINADSRGRYFYFSCYSNWQDGIPIVLNSITPFPYGIEFGDSFDTVYEKLGLTDEMVSDGTNLETSDMVNVYIDYPGDEIASIGMYFNDCSFSYYFNETTYVLEYYSVDVHTSIE